MKNTQKGSPLDVQLRVNRILELLAQGKSRIEIQTTIKDEFNVSQSTINSDIIKALAELKNNQEPFLSEIKTIIVDRFEVVWKEAISRGDLKTAANILKEQVKMFGLEAPQKVEVDAGDFKIEFN